VTPATNTGTLKRDHVYYLEIELGGSETVNDGPFYEFSCKVQKRQSKKRESRLSVLLNSLKKALLQYWETGAR